MEKLIFDLLSEQTTVFSLYTGGGEEPTYVSFVYSEDRDKNDFLKELSKRLAEKLTTIPL